MQRFKSLVFVTAVLAAGAAIAANSFSGGDTVTCSTTAAALSCNMNDTSGTACHEATVINTSTTPVLIASVADPSSTVAICADATACPAGVGIELGTPASAWQCSVSSGTQAVVVFGSGK